MVVMQIQTATVNKTLYDTNLPNGLYELRLIDISYIDTLPSTDRSLISVSSDCWRVPYGNKSKSNTLYFLNKGDTKPSLNGQFAFLAEIRNGQMDLSLSVPTANSFAFVLFTFDVQPAKSFDNFFPLM